MKGERLGELEEVVLLAAGLLGDKASTLSIQEALEREANRRTSMGAVYAALDRLERKGFIASTVRDSSGVAGRRKRHYEVTREGHQALRESRDVRERMWRAVCRRREGAVGRG